MFVSTVPVTSPPARPFESVAHWIVAFVDIRSLLIALVGGEILPMNGALRGADGKHYRNSWFDVSLARPYQLRLVMIRITTRLQDKEIVAAIQAQGRERVREFATALFMDYADPILLEEMVDALLAELERRASKVEA